MLAKSTAPKQIPTDTIRTDGGTQMRVELDRDVYLDYRDKMLAEVKFPPIVVFFDGSTYWLAVEVDLDADPSDLDEVLAAFLIAQLDEPLDPAAVSSLTTPGAQGVSFDA